MRQAIREDPAEASAQHALLANLRHNLRTPMNAIIGYSEMLLEDQDLQDNWTNVTLLQKVHMFGKQILAAIDTVLNMANLEASQSRLNIVDVGESFRVSLRSPINAVLSNCELLLESATADIAPDVEKIRTAAQRLLTIIDDIVATDREKTPASAPKEEEILSSPSQEVVSAIHALEDRSEDRSPDLGEYLGSILVVDDNETNRDLLSRKLERHGHQVKTAASGQQALEMVAEDPYDLILLDIIMPEMNGYEVLEHLKANEASARIPVIVVSALDEIDSVATCIERGAEDYLPKPFNPVLLKARVDACLEKKHLHDSEIALNQRLQDENVRLNHLNEQLQIQISERQQSEAKEREKSHQLAQALKKLQDTQLKLVQSEKMSSLGQLVAGVAHEINNPVSCIHGNLPYTSLYIQHLLQLVDMYQRKFPQSDADIQDYIEDIDLAFLKKDLPKLLSSMEMGTERIREIVRSLRLFSRSDRSQKKAADLHENIDSTLMILSNRLKANPKRPAIQVIKEYGALPAIQCYAGQMNQVFMNILANAIDALEEDLLDKQQRGTGNCSNNTFSTANAQSQNPTIRIITQRLENDRISIRIADNGTGMEESVQQHLFDPFFTTKPVGKGTGMGMSISHQIVTETHGGKLRCISTPNQGTEFAIEIPIR